MPPRGSEEYYQSRGSRRDYRPDSTLAEQYSQRQERLNRDRLAQLSEEGQIAAEGTREMGRVASEGIKGAENSYYRGKEFKRQGELDARDAQMQARNMELSEEQLAKSRMERSGFQKEQDLLDATDIKTGQTGRQRKFASDLALSEEQLAAQKANRHLAEKQTMMIGELSPQEKQAAARAEVQDALLAAQGAKTPEERAKFEAYARSKMAAAKMEPGAFDVRGAEAAGKYAANQKANATAENVAVTTDSIYQKVTPQITELDARAKILGRKLDALKSFEDASSFGSGEAAPLAEITSGLSPEKAARINASYGQGNVSTKTDRAKEVLAGEIAQLENELLLLQAQSNNASPQARQVLARDIEAQKQQIRLLKGRTQAPQAPADGGPWQKYRNGPPAGTTQVTYGGG